MIPYPNIDPVLVQIGPLAVRWYGLMYVAGFAASYLLVVYQITKKGVGITRAKIDDLYFYLILGLLIGARLGYVIFYNLGFYVEHPLEVAVLWHGGMSFHGGLLGAFVAGYIVIKRKRMDFWKVADLKENKRVLLLAQMKVPGKAWLEFDIQDDRLVQTAHFHPRGVLGRVYWYAVLPFHELVFKNLAEKIVARAAGASGAGRG